MPQDSSVPNPSGDFEPLSSEEEAREKSGQAFPREEAAQDPPAAAKTEPKSPGAELGEEEDLFDESLPVPQGDEAKAILEALLFSATSPLTEKRLGRLLNGVDAATIRSLIEELRREYAGVGRGVVIMEVAGGYQIATRAEFAEWVFRLHSHRRRSALSPAVLETLAIIAYKQPIVRADVEAIRGVDCGGILRALQDSGMVEVVGRKEVVGRPPLYGTTDLFLKSFGLKRLSDLPSLDELQALLAETAEESGKGTSGAGRASTAAAGQAEESDRSDGSVRSDRSDRAESPRDLAGGEGG